MEQETFDKQTTDAWNAYFRVHGGDVPEPRQVRNPDDTAKWLTLSDAKRVDGYSKDANVDQFKRDVTYQLYCLTELALWLYKRLPRNMLVLSNEQKGAADRKTQRENGGMDLEKSVEHLIALSNQKIGPDPLVPRLELKGQSHDTPPPPPGWPPQP